MGINLNLNSYTVGLKQHRPINSTSNCNWGTCIAPPTRRPRAHRSWTISCVVLSVTCFDLNTCVYISCTQINLLTYLLTNGWMVILATTMLLYNCERIKHHQAVTCYACHSPSESSAVRPRPTIERRYQHVPTVRHVTTRHFTDWSTPITGQSYLYPGANILYPAYTANRAYYQAKRRNLNESRHVRERWTSVKLSDIRHLLQSVISL